MQKLAWLLLVGLLFSGCADKAADDSPPLDPGAPLETNDTPAPNNSSKSGPTPTAPPAAPPSEPANQTTQDNSTRDQNSTAEGNVTEEESPPAERAEPWSGKCTASQNNGAGGSAGGVTTGINRDTGCTVSGIPPGPFTSAVFVISHNAGSGFQSFSGTLKSADGTVLARATDETSNPWTTAAANLEGLDLSALDFSVAATGAWQAFTWTVSVEMKP